jgi:flagellar motor switch protein FliG
MAGKREMSGAQKAAAFLMSLDKEAAANVLKSIDEKVIVELVEAMGRLEAGMTDGESIRKLERELIKTLRKPRTARVRSDDELHTMLEQTLGKQQAGELFEKIQQRLLHERPFLVIENQPAEFIHRALEQESEAVVALVLAHLDPSLSAEILGYVDADKSLAVVRRMAKLIPPGFDTLVAIAHDLDARVRDISHGPVGPDPQARLRTIAEVLNFSQPPVEKGVLEGLAKEDTQMAAEIREFMFTWENLADLDKRAMQKVLASIDTKTLAISLKGSTAPVEENIMNNLSSRVREMIRDERETAGPMSMSDVLAARNEVMKAVRALMESGEFRPTRAGEELVN